MHYACLARHHAAAAELSCITPALCMHVVPFCIVMGAPSAPRVGGTKQHVHCIPCCVVVLYRYMPDLLSIKVVGRIPRAKRSKLYHILQDESPKHIYQTSVEVQQS